jgi:hypothetical protein
MQQCQAIKNNGGRCLSPAQPGSEWCYNHDPALKDKRSHYARRAGRASSRNRKANEELLRLQQVFEQLAEKVMKGEADRANAAVAGQLLNYARACIKDAVSAREGDEIAAMVEELWEEREKARRAG